MVLRLSPVRRWTALIRRISICALPLRKFSRPETPLANMYRIGGSALNVLFLFPPHWGVMVINKMTFAPARDDRIHVYVSILESLVSMLNEALLSGASKRQVKSTARSKFQNALRVHFDSWIENGKLDPSPKDEYPLFTMRHRLGNNGVAEFFLDFRLPRDISRPMMPESEALMWYWIFLTIEGRKLLSRCSKCERYFLRKRLPKGGQQPTTVRRFLSRA